MGTGNAKVENFQQLLTDIKAIADGTNWIPFQRMSPTRTNIEKFTTISVPQMVTSERTHEAIMTKLTEETSKRLDHHLSRALGK